MADAPTLADDLTLLLEAAEEAAALALAAFRVGGAPDARVWAKADATPVTEADLAVNAALARRLRAARPSYGWLSEEDADDTARLDAARVFIVDPIDGTRAFAAGEPDFSVSIAIVERGAPIAGVVAAPALGRVYAAAAGQGATRRSAAGVAPIRAAAAVEPDGARTAIRLDALAPALWRGAPPTVDRRRYRSTALAAAEVAEGSLDAFVALRRVHEWDLAAAAVIAAEAGASAQALDGAALVFNRVEPWSAGAVVAPPALAAALRARIAAKAL